MNRPNLSWSAPVQKPDPIKTVTKKPNSLFLYGILLLLLSWNGAHYVWGDGHGFPATFLALWWVCVSIASLLGAGIVLTGAILVNTADL